MKLFLRFAFQPIENPQNRGKNTWITFTFVYIIYSVCSNIAIYFLFSKYGYNVPLKTDAIDNIHIGILLLLPPILEEIGFRLSLIRSKLYVFMSLCVISFLVLSKLGFGIVYSLDSLILRISVAIIIGIIMFFIMGKSILTAKFSVYFYTLVLAFSLIHCLNYQFSEINTLGSFVYILTYGLIKIPSSIILGYIRLSNGFVPVVCSHILHNAPTIIIRHIV